MTDMYRLSIQEIATRLEMRKQYQTSTVLVLGSRAGALFRSQSFYEMLSHLDPRGVLSVVLQLPHNEAFEDCYHILQRKEDLGRSDLHGIINRALQEVPFTDEDEALARLIQQGYFSDIITTNVDNVLEEALRHAGLRAGKDFETIYPSKDLLSLVPSRRRIMKVFGDFPGNYAIRGRMQYLTTGTRSVLEPLLRKDILMVGIDPAWDEELLLACPLLGDTLWYVSEETSLPLLIERLLRGRPGAIFSGADGQYSQFFSKLSKEIHPDEVILAMTSHEKATGQQAGTAQAASNGQAPVQPSAAAAPDPAISQTPDHKRSKIFVPYSRGDKKYLDRLHVHLNQNHVLNELSVWDDTKILPGTSWRKEIERALEETRIAIPLVSADFFASKFIMDEEIPPLLEAAQRGEVVIISVVVSPCLFKESPLGQFQALNDPKDALSKLPKAKQEDLWMQLAKHVKKILDKDKH